MSRTPNPMHPIVLIASGSTSWQEARRVQGSTDLPLSDEGRAAVQSAAASLGVDGVKTVHCAPDEASRETAAIFAAVLGGPRVRVVEELAEPNLGLWQGLTLDQIEDRYPTTYEQWCEDPWRVQISEAESLEHAAMRLQAAIQRLMKRSSRRSVVLVLRPILLGLARDWISPSDQPWRPNAQLPAVQKFDIPPEKWTQLLASAKKKLLRRMSA